MNNGWTKERKAKQAKAIQDWKPWKQSTGPETIAGKSKVARNAWKGGKRPEFREIIRSMKSELASLRYFEELDS